jgi:hypothetical protein
MTEAQLRELLSQETLAWAERSPVGIVAELAKPQTYRRGTGDTWHEIEVTLLEATDDYIHVKTSIHDGGLVWALKPITSTFLIYRDGRSFSSAFRRSNRGLSSISRAVLSRDRVADVSS